MLIMDVQMFIHIRTFMNIYNAIVLAWIYRSSLSFLLSEQSKF